MFSLKMKNKSSFLHMIYYAHYYYIMFLNKILSITLLFLKTVSMVSFSKIRNKTSHIEGIINTQIISALIIFISSIAFKFKCM